MSTNNEATITPNTGFTVQTKPTSQSNLKIGKPVSNPLRINSNESQQVTCDNKRSIMGNKEHDFGTSVNFPIAGAALTQYFSLSHRF